ncbi:uncharacterized protein TNCV_2695611 [Trichonephila clavipes]|nr:uncharacterized protein TNCV_2695611 [Trichonephila clavipes]
MHLGNRFYEGVTIDIDFDQKSLIIPDNQIKQLPQMDKLVDIDLTDTKLEDTKYVGRNIERLFDEARRNMRKKHKSWEKYYNRRRRDVHIKVNDLVLIQTHFLSAAGRKQVRVYRSRQTDTISSDSQVETLYDEHGVSHGSNIDRIKGSLKSTGKPLVRKVRGVDHGRVTTRGRSPETNAKVVLMSRRTKF